MEQGRTGYPGGPGKATFAELLGEVGRVAPFLTAPLAPPAAEAEIERLERWLGTPVPEEAREVYRLHDGQRAGGRVPTLFNHGLLSIAQALDELGVHREIRESGICEDDPLLDRRLSEGFPSAYHVPLLSDDTGNFVGYDVRPGPAGTYGQVLVFGGDVDAQVVCGSLPELWGALLDELRRGNWALRESERRTYPRLSFKNQDSEVARLLSL